MRSRRRTASTSDDTAVAPTSAPSSAAAPMRTEMIQRTSSTSEGAGTPGSTPKIWRALRKIQSISSNKDKEWGHRFGHTTSTTDSEGPESVHNPKSPEPSSTTNVLLESPESNFRQLQALVQRMRSAPSGPNHVDTAFKEYHKIKDQCSALCRIILQEELRRVRDPNGAEVLPRRGSSIESPRSPGLFDTRSSFSGRSLAEVVTGSGVSKGVPPSSESWLGVIRDWKMCLETLCEHFKISLAETYKTYEQGVTQEMVDLLFTNRKFRREAVHRMRNTSVTRAFSPDPQYFPRYEIRFRNYEKVKQELNDIRQLLQSAESGIAPDRQIDEYPITPRGDTVLEFLNFPLDASTANDPVLRFRVSSYMLAETSPIFARMFSGHSGSLQVHDDDDINALLPSPPTKYICKDGTEAKLYRMPQRELNRLGCFEILLHAAHMHNDKVPREVTFEQFVAIAECCMRYKSTSPLELMVEHRWLPQWMHKGADDMPDGLLVISYAFGLRQLFTRMSKTAIMNLVDEKELNAKPWPQKIKDKIWAVRCAKVAQVNYCCINTVQEYIRPTFPRTPEIETPPPQEPRGSFFAPVVPATPLTSIPRCPKGSHWCDATNLGWLMLVYNEMDLLPHILQSDVLSHLTNPASRPRSLAQMVDALRRIPSPTTPVHRGVCDPGPAFRAAISDIYNSVSGLTLFDISGRSHGWALSKHNERKPQTQLATGLARMAIVDRSHSVATEFPEIVRLRIFSHIDDLDDLHAAARVNRAFYETYKRHELFLMRNILRMDRKRAGTLRRPIPMSISNAEEKILKTESDVIKANPNPDAADAVTLRSDDEEEEDYSDFEDDMSLYSSIAPSSLNRSVGRGSSVRSHGPDQRRSAEPLRLRTGSPNGMQRPQTAAPATHSTGFSSPTTPRQVPLDRQPISATSPAKPTVTLTEDIDEPPLTEEEAHRILWPEAAIRAVSPPPITQPPPGVEGIREKFRAGDLSLLEELEEKTLVPTGDKALRIERDRRVGLIKTKDGDGETGEGSRGAK